MFRVISVAAVFLMTAPAFAESVPITGNVASTCSIYTDTAGVYGVPSPDELSTAPIDGGVHPIVRYDVTIADYYVAKIAWPDSFATSPSLTDAVNWDGEVSVSQTSNAAQADYETNKVEYDNVTEYDLTVAGSVWFEIESTVNYGYDKSFPGGTYAANVTAECIAT